MRRFWILIGALTVFSLPLLAQAQSVEAILQEMNSRLLRVNPDPQVPFSAQEIRDLNEIARLRNPFLRAQAKADGILLRQVRSSSALDTLMMFHHYFKEAVPAPN